MHSGCCSGGLFQLLMLVKAGDFDARRALVGAVGPALPVDAEAKLAQLGVILARCCICARLARFNDDAILEKEAFAGSLINPVRTAQIIINHNSDAVDFCLLGMNIHRNRPGFVNRDVRRGHLISYGNYRRL